jgi:hypothetical protein
MVHCRKFSVEEYSVLGCNVMSFRDSSACCLLLLVFLLTLLFNLKMEEIRSSETYSCPRSIQRYNPEDSSLHGHHHENVKSK